VVQALFRRPPVRTGRAPFSASGSPATFYVQAAAGFPPWMTWWQGAQTMSVLRLIFVIRAAHAGGCCPGEVRSASLRTWWVSTVARWPHHSHSPRRSRVTSSLRRMGGAGRRPFQRDAAEPCDQWLPARPLLAGLVTGTRPVVGDDRGLVLAGHLRHRRAVLAGQGLQHRHLSRAVQPVQFMNVPGEQVVLDEPPVLRAVGADDLEVVQVQQPGPVPRLAVDQVGGLPGRDHLPGHAQPDHAVDGGPGRAVLGDDVIAEEPRLLGAGVGDQRLVR
jgi:hypothetical protein